MIQYIFISILIYLILAGIIAFLIYLLFKKRNRKINEFNKNVVEREKILKNINEKTVEEIKEVENEIKKADNIGDFVNIFMQL